MNLADVLFISSLVFSEISEVWQVKCFRKFPKGGGLNYFWKFTGQGICSHIHSEGCSALGWFVHDYFVLNIFGQIFTNES